MMEKITGLTENQKVQFKPWVKKWVGIGLSTEAADFDRAEKAALEAYGLCGLDRPMIVLRVGSPYAATIAGAIAWDILKKTKNIYEVKAQVGAQVEAQVRAQVADQVKAQVWDQVRAQVGAQVGDQVRAQVRDQVGDQVRAQVRDQVGAQVRDQVWAQVADQVRDQVWAQVWAQVGAQVGDQVRDQVEAQVGDQVWAQVGDQVRAQVRAQVRDQVGAQVRDQVWAQVGDQVRAQVRAQVGAQVGDQVRAQVADQVKAQVGDFGKNAKEGFNNYGIASLWCTLSAFSSFFRDVCQLTFPEEIHKRLEINEALVSSVGWTWWHENIFVSSDRPRIIKRDDQGHLHCENGPSIEYRDGWALYHWHGVSIPKEWVSGQKPTAQDAISWPQIEQRRAACEIAGWGNILEELDASIIDVDDDPEVGILLECSLPDAGKQRFLKVVCGTGRMFVLPVPPSCETALEGNLWTYGIDANRSFIPEVRT